MANPNRAMAYVAKNPAAYTTFRSDEFGRANRCAEYYANQGYKVRVTRFRIGPKNKIQFNYKVTVSWKEGQKPADVASWKFKAENQ